MLVLDKSLSCIEVDAQNILTLYRSTSAVPVAAEGLGNLSWHAFICTTQEQNAYCIFMALYSADQKKTLVYVPEKQPKDKDEYVRLLPQAIKFAEEMGFMMEAIKIDYSKALREVIISDTRVIKPVGHAKRTAVKKAVPDEDKADRHNKTEEGKKNVEKGHTEAGATETVPVQKNRKASHESVNDTATESHTNAHVSVQRVSEETTAGVSKLVGAAAKEMASLDAEAKRLLAESASGGKEVARELLEKRQKIERLSAERTAAENAAAAEIEGVQAEIDRLLAEKTASEKVLAEKLASLRSDMGKVSREKAAAEKAAANEIDAAQAELEKILGEKDATEADLAKKLASLCREIERLSAENDSAIKPAVAKELAAEIANAQAELNELVSARAAEETELAGKLESVREEMGRLNKEKIDTETAYAKNIGDARYEIERLTTERTAAEATAAETLAALRAEVERLCEEKESAAKDAAKEIETAQAEVERLVGELEACESDLAKELAMIRKEILRLNKEKAADENTTDQELAEARAEIERLTADKTSAEVAAAEKLASLLAEAERLSAEKADAEIATLEEMKVAQAEVDRLNYEKSAVQEELAERLASIREEKKRLTDEKSAAEKASKKELDDARDEIERLTAEKTAAEATLAEKLASLRSDAESLSAEKAIAGKAASKELATAREEVAQLAEEINAVEKGLAEELALIRNERESLSAERAAAEKAAKKALAEAKAELEQLTAEKTDAEATSLEKLASVRSEAEKLSKEKMGFEMAAAQGLETARIEIARIADEKSAAEAAFGEQLDSLRSEADKLARERDEAEKNYEAEVASVKESLFTMVGGITGGVKSLVEKLSYIQAESEKFLIKIGAFAESENIETAMAQFNLKTEPVSRIQNVVDPRQVEREQELPTEEYSHKTGVERRTVDKSTEKTVSEEKATVETVPSMKFEGGHLSVEKALAELNGPGQVQTLGIDSEDDQKGPEFELQPQESVVMSLEEAAEGIIASSCTEDVPEDGFPELSADDDTCISTEFHIDKSMPSIDYGSMEDVVEVHQSLNVTRVTPEGYLAQNSKAYVCALKKRGGKSVYIGLHLTDNDQVLIYSPEKQPKSGNLRKTIQDAIDFLETAGFLMDPVSLGNDTKSRAKVLGRIPVLCKAS
jgi:hypothetical protein